ncbi:hypothetical protein FACS1894200_04800 [Spirochaetia bacterium]|nr:hypothetical protein FACS1894200_04800 [Spirochaetia bacterium]
MAEDTEDRIDWHAAFYDAIRLELEEYLDVLNFEFEHPINTMPLLIDALIIKKNKNTDIKKNIAKVFKSVNIVEYKSPEDSLSVQDFHKAIAYVHLYCATVTDADINDITLNIVLNRRPRAVLAHIKKVCNYKVTNTGKGIYEVKSHLFPIQIIETKLLSENENIWLRDLRNNLTAKEMDNVLQKSNPRLKLPYISSYLEALINSNTLIMEELKMQQTQALEDVLVRMGIAAKFEASAVEKVALKMKKRGVPLEQIAEDTGLSPNEIVKL